MKKLTTLLTALLAIAMMTGPSLASGFSKQLAPNTFGTGDIPDGVSYEEFGGTLDTHYGVAPAWEVRPEGPRTMGEELRKQLAPRTVGTGDIPDGVSYEEFRGTIDTHYGIAPVWEGRPEEPRTMSEELRKHIAPNVDYGKDVN